MMIHRCCGCGCNQVNFKQFDFSDGTLSWQAFLYSPVVATNGDVYAVNYDAETQATEITGSFSGAVKTLTLPVPSINGDSYWRTYSIDRYNLGGVHQGNSGQFDYVQMGAYVPDWPLNQSTVNLAGEAFGYAGTNRGMIPAGRAVNDDGLMCFTAGAPTLSCLTEGAHAGTGTVTYHLPFTRVRGGTLELTMDSEGTASAHSAATFDVYDSAATVQGDIVTAFGANATSVTVTGTSIGETGLTVVIVWDDAQHYLKTYKISSAVRLGALYTRSLRDAKAKGYHDNTKYSSAYLNPGFWQHNGDLFRVSASTSDATVTVVESIEGVPGSPPEAMSVVWTDSPLGSRTPINPAETGVSVSEYGTGGGICGMSFFLTSGIAGGSDRMSVLTWNDDGTGIEDYANSGNHWTGDDPRGLSFQDGGTSVSVLRRIWRDQAVVLAFGDSYATKTYRSETGDSTIAFTTGSGGSLTHAINRGDFSYLKSFGFNITHCAFACDLFLRGRPDQLEVNTVTSNDLIGRQSAIEGSGIYHTVTASEIDWFAFIYEFGSRVNTLSDEHTQWRLRWVSGADTVQMQWMQETATLADLNAELLTAFGSDFNSDQNVLATVAADASPISVPIYKRLLTIEAHGATGNSSDDESEMGTPPLFTTAGSTAVLGYGNMPQCYLDIEDYTYGPAISDTFGAINWSTGAVTWGRDFNATGDAVGVDECLLHGGNLHVLSSDSHCEE